MGRCWYYHRVKKEIPSLIVYGSRHVGGFPSKDLSLVYRVKTWAFGFFSWVFGQFRLPAPFGTGRKVLGSFDGSDYWPIHAGSSNCSNSFEVI